MKVIFLLMFFALPSLTYAETFSWIGPVDVISEGFKKNGGILGFTHSFDQGDCCCGGPSTSDSYPTSLNVDEKGNIILAGHDEGGQILIFSPVGKKTGEIHQYPRQGEAQCTSWGSNYWPGRVNVADSKVFVNPGCCAAVYDYRSKLLWEVYPDIGQCYNLDAIYDKKAFFRNGKRGSNNTMDNFAPHGGWLVYSMKGKIEAEITDPQKIYQQDKTTGDLYVNGKKFGGVLQKNDQSQAFTDAKGQLFLAFINDQPGNFEKRSSYPAGAIKIFSESSVHFYTITLPENRYVKQSRTCSGEDGLVFAGRDVIEEYGNGIAVGKDGSVYATLYIPKGLKVVKWVKVDMDMPLPNEVIARLEEKGIKNAINEIYARKGRPFTKSNVKATFESQPWYKVDPSFSEEKLSETDRNNLRQLQDALKRKSQQKPI